MIRNARYSQYEGPRRSLELRIAGNSLNRVKNLRIQVTPLFWVVLHVKALELDKLVKPKFAEGLPFTRVLPPCPSQILDHR